MVLEFFILKSSAVNLNIFSFIDFLFSCPNLFLYLSLGMAEEHSAQLTLFDQ